MQHLNFTENRLNETFLGCLPSYAWWWVSSTDTPLWNMMEDQWCFPADDSGADVESEEYQGMSS